MAQAGGWGGDVALLGEGTKPFLVGAGSFAVGHVAYLTGFVRRRNHEPLTEPLEVRVIAGSWLVSAPALALLARRQQPELAAPVFGYATMLAAMAVGAHRLDATVPASARRLTMAGASLFMVSDTLLGIRMFVFKEPPAGLETSRHGDVRRRAVSPERRSCPGLKAGLPGLSLTSSGVATPEGTMSTRLTA